MTMCDKCHVAAAVFEVLTPAGPLYLCGHDYNANAAAFTRLGYLVGYLDTPASVEIPAPVGRHRRYH